ncbi:MAG: hypothetical protein IIX81_01300 [Tidjanibacter sp.]|nr:hypothetical protein [Tidjanibacter sp.]
MKKIEYEEAFGSLSKMIDIYRGKIKEALEERNIAVVYFGNAPAVNPSDDEYFDCYSLLKYENGEMLLADGSGLDEYPEESTVLTAEQVAAGEINNCHFAKAFAQANWQLWDDVEEEGPNSWDSLYYCLCEAINECADEE